jgi:hypothetical protein
MPPMEVPSGFCTLGNDASASETVRHHIVVASLLSRIKTSSLLEHIEWLKQVERAGRTRCCRPLRAAPSVVHVDAGIEADPFISWRRG